MTGQWWVDTSTRNMAGTVNLKPLRRGFSQQTQCHQAPEKVQIGSFIHQDHIYRQKDYYRNHIL